jgi:serine/threonine protein kinase
VIHRDIKPENVVVEGGKWGGRVYLIDFGGVQGSSGLGVWPPNTCSNLLPSLHVYDGTPGPNFRLTVLLHWQISRESRI